MQVSPAVVQSAGTQQYLVFAPHAAGVEHRFGTSRSQQACAMLPLHSPSEPSLLQLRMFAMH